MTKKARKKLVASCKLIAKTKIGFDTRYTQSFLEKLTDERLESLHHCMLTENDNYYWWNEIRETH